MSIEYYSLSPPPWYSDSANTSRTMSRMSTDQDQDQGHMTSVTTGTETVSQLVNKVMTRVRRITLCDPADHDDTSDDGDEGSDNEDLKRATSCPNLTLLPLHDSGAKPVKSSGQKNKLRFSSGTQTDPSLEILPYEALFPLALPLSGQLASVKPLPAPQQLLESYIDVAVTGANKDLKAQIQLLRSQVH